MALDLEIAGAVRELGPDEITTPTYAPTVIKRLRDSHHGVAKLLAHGLTPIQVSLQTGYALQRIYVLQRDPSFQELMAFYRAHHDAEGRAFEEKMLGAAQDAVQEFHERLHDAPETVTVDQLLESIKVLADRAGFAPVQRSVNKNLNLNVGDRLDAARARNRPKDAA